VEYLEELARRANLDAWEQWSIQYRVLAVVVGLLVAYWALSALVPTILRVLRPLLFLAVVLAAVWALYPKEFCSIGIFATLPLLCAQ
jgi:hypothetical protein